MGSRSCSRARVPGLDVPSVDVDNVGAGAAAPWSICSSLGHRRIASSPMRRWPTPRPRNGCAATGTRSTRPASRYDADAGRGGRLRRGERRTRRGRPARADHLLTALFVASDVLALGAINALREARSASARRRLGRGLRRHRAGALLRSATDHRPPARLRARTGRRTCLARPNCRSSGRAADAAPHGARRPRFDRTTNIAWDSAIDQLSPAFRRSG